MHARMKSFDNSLSLFGSCSSTEGRKCTTVVIVHTSGGGRICLPNRIAPLLAGRLCFRASGPLDQQTFNLTSNLCGFELRAPSPSAFAEHVEALAAAPKRRTSGVRRRGGRHQGENNRSLGQECARHSQHREPQQHGGGSKGMHPGGRRYKWPGPPPGYEYVILCTRARCWRACAASCAASLGWGRTRISDVKV